jgi:hypothetical protein
MSAPAQALVRSEPSRPRRTIAVRVVRRRGRGATPRHEDDRGPPDPLLTVRGETPAHPARAGYSAGATGEDPRNRNRSGG